MVISSYFYSLLTLRFFGSEIVSPLRFLLQMNLNWVWVVAIMHCMKRIKSDRNKHSLTYSWLGWMSLTAGKVKNKWACQSWHMTIIYSTSISGNKGNFEWTPFQFLETVLGVHYRGYYENSQCSCVGQLNSYCKISLRAYILSICAYQCYQLSHINPTPFCPYASI